MNHPVIKYHIGGFNLKQFRKIVGEPSHYDGRVEDFQMPGNFGNQYNCGQGSAYHGYQEGCHAEKHKVTDVLVRDNLVMY